MKVREKSKTCEAFQWNGESIDKLPAWFVNAYPRLVVLPGRSEDEEPLLLILHQDLTKPRSVEVRSEIRFGSWVVTDMDENHSFDVCAQGTFDNRYEETQDGFELVPYSEHDGFSLSSTPTEVVCSDFTSPVHILLKCDRVKLADKIELKGKIATISEIGNSVLTALGAGDVAINRADLDLIPVVTE